MSGADIGDAHASTRRAAYGTLAIVGLSVASALGSDASVSALVSVEGLARARRVASGLLHPELGSELLWRTGQLLVESVAIGCLGVALALMLGVPLALVATRLPTLDDAADSSPSPAATALRLGARGVLAFFRSVPEIVWAYLFVRVFGLGPAPAVVAIGLSFAGIVGKLFAEIAEATDPAPARALVAAGVGRVGVWLFAVLPQVRRSWSGYALFRLECAIRSAAILGVVGAGGLGADIMLSIRYFQYERLSTALLALVSTIVMLETWSAYVRRAKRRNLDFATLGLGAALGWFFLDANWSSLWDASALRLAGSFLVGFTRPTLSVLFSLETWRLVGETLSMAMFGTLVAAVIAGGLAPLASGALLMRGHLPSAPRPRGPTTWALSSAMLSVRALFASLRALPELVLALIFVVWVGPGPLAGALAVAAHTVGILGRLFAEVYEDTDAAPARQLEAAGATRFAVWLYGLVPQAAPRLLAFVLFRFEVNVRATAMVGFVAAGGIGDAIDTAIALFHMSELAALLLVLLATVVVVDVAGDRLRSRLLA